MDTTSKILADNSNFINLINYLREKSKYYPEIYTKEIPSNRQGYITNYLSTLVRIKRNKKWYYIHVIQDNTIDNTTLEAYKKGITAAYKDFITSVQKSKYLYRLNGYEYIDTLQLSEKERLLKIQDNIIKKINAKSYADQMLHGPISPKYF